MSDAPAREASGTDDAPRWVASPLLLGARGTPRFLRAPWDADQSQAFGPWRVAQRSDPARSPDESPSLALPPTDGEGAAPASADTPVQVEIVPAGSGITPEQLSEAQAQAYARGLADGAAQARAQGEEERAREGELLRHLAIEMRALSEDPDRFFEPLRRLALHIAEQLVRGELQASGQAVSQIVRQCLAALDAPSDKVLVNVHPDDAALLQAMAPAFMQGLRLQPDGQLTRGSVRLRMDDTVMEDLIEHRLQALVERLAVQPGGRVAESVLLRDSPRAEPTAPSPRRGRAAGEIIDATVLPSRANPTASPTSSGDPDGGSGPAGADSPQAPE